MPDDRSVARRAVKDVVRRDQHSRSRHVLDDSRGFTRNVLSEVARDKPGVRIIASTGGAADDELDGFALIELLDRGSEHRGDKRYRDEARKEKYAECLRHEPPPCNLSVLLEAIVAREVKSSGSQELNSSSHHSYRWSAAASTR